MQRFWNFFINNFRITYLLLIAVILFGIFSIFQMPKESSPEVDIPVAVVTTALPGAPAQDVEGLVTDPIEDQIEGISNIDTLTSSSRTGFSQIAVQFSTDSDTDDSVSELRNRVERATPELPSDATDPVVQKVSFSDMPILSLSISGPYDPAELKDYAETIETAAEGVGSVSQANVIGAPTPVVEVVLSESRLAQYSLSPNDIVRAIQQADADIPIGSITTASGVYNLRFAGRLTTVGDVQQVPVAAVGGTVVFVSDVADVRATFERQDVITRLSNTGAPAESAVNVQVFKESGEGNILSIADTIDERIASLTAAGELPSDLVITRTQDDAELIRTDLNNLVSSGVITMIIIFISLLLFLGWREALLASLAIPVTFLIAFIALNYLGYTINFLTLFSLILALGILVDAAIVVTEGISSYMRAGLSAREAAKETIQEFARPLTAGTLTTVFVFFPMLLAGGIIGEFIKSIPITVTIVLLAALFVALGVITTIASRFFTRQGVMAEHGVADKAIARAYRWYGRYIDKLLSIPKRGRRFLITISVLFVVALSLPFVGVVSLELFPQSDMDSVTINLEMPVGTPLGETSREVAAVEEFLRAEGTVESFTSTVGSAANPGSLTTGTSRSHVAGIIVNLYEDREQSSTEIIGDYEARLPALTTAEVTLSQMDSGPEQGQPIQVRVIGDDLGELEQAAESIAEKIRSLPGTRNVESGVSNTAGDFVLTVDAPQARRYGLSPQQVAMELRAAVSGLEAVTLKSSGEDTDVKVFYDISTEDSRLGALPTSVSAIEGIYIQTPQQGNMPLSAFVSVGLGAGQSTINHEDGDRSITISGGVTETGNPQTITATLTRQHNAGELELPDGVSLSFGGEAEEIQESFTDLFLSMIIGVMLIFGLLVWQFSSFRTPLIMLTTIPLAFIGVFGGLAITLQPLSFPAFIGVVALAGIVVNNAIILIDRIHLNKDEGADHETSIREAAKSRLQPILLTTITTVGGMIPLAFADPSWAPLAYAVIFGLLFSTVLTLVVIPLLYQRFGR